MSEIAAGVRVLVVEDSPTQAAMLGAILEEEDFRVGTARDGREAAALFDREPFGIVLSDIVMPGMDGFELCRHIKAAPPGRSAPVILLTAMNDPMDIARGLDAGADDFVAKPYDPGELVVKMRRLLAARAGAAGTGDRAQMVGLLVGAFEASARKGAELEARNAELAEARLRLKAGATGPAPATWGLLTLDRAGTVTGVNPTGARALGWEGAGLDGRNGLRDVLTPPGSGATPPGDSVAGVLAGAPAFDRVAAVFRTRTGEALAVVHACVPMRDAAAGLLGVAVLFHVRPSAEASAAR